MSLFHVPSRHVPPTFGLDLSAGQAWSTPSDHSVDIECQRGSVWITVEGDPEDHVVVAPGHFRPVAHGRIAAYALEPAHVFVKAA